LVFHDVGHDHGQFSDLLPQGVGVVPRQGLAATAAGSGFASDGSANLIGRNEQAWVPGMAGLAAALLAGLIGWRRRASFAAKAVRRGRQRGVTGIGVELGLGVGKLLLELADLCVLLGDQGKSIVEFHLEATVGGLQIGNALLRIGSLQLNDPSAQGAQVQTHVLRHLGQRFLIHHADRHHVLILPAQRAGDYG
jgi:hypothetical protein